MSVSDRLFEPPAQDLARINARLARLPVQLSVLIQRAGDALSLGKLPEAQAVLAQALAFAPGQPDVLRLYGLLLARLGNLRAALLNFEAALRAAPDDAMGYWQYAQVCEEAGDVASALRIREHAARHLPDSPTALADLGEHFVRHERPDEALPLLEQATRMGPGYAPAQLKLGNALVMCGRAREGAAAMRRALALEPGFGAAWIDLVNIKTEPLAEDELSRMREMLTSRSIHESERTAIGYALAAAIERRGEYAESLALLVEANARRKRELVAWNAEEFMAVERASDAAFSAPHARATNPRLGEEVIFIAGMPRSGTTLIEQILAAHPSVEGAGELQAVLQVLGGESARLTQRYPGWVKAAGADDWQRLGEHYLALTAPLREGRARFTDKMPGNWRAIGAIRAMLPGARIVIARRDPLENCWSCFKQYFTDGWHFTNDVDHLALFWRAFDRAATAWAAREPAHVRELSHERLTEAPEREIRALLEFCGLPFDPACLASHQVRRSVHTLSAAQVRQPIQRRAGIAAAYGPLLDPLRAALQLPSSGEPTVPV